MFTLVYIKNQFNRPSTLLPFLQSNIGKTPLLQIDCITPFHGTEKDLAFYACNYLSSIDSEIEVSCCSIKNSSSEVKGEMSVVNFIVIQITISRKKC